MLPKDLTRDVKIRLATIRGQIDGLIKMIDKEDNYEKIVNQFKAVDNGLEASYNILLNEVYRKALALKIVEVTDACPGNCGNEDEIESLRQLFPHIKLEEILKKLNEIEKIGEKVNQYNKKNN